MQYFFFLRQYIATRSRTAYTCAWLKSEARTQWKMKWTLPQPIEINWNLIQVWDHSYSNASSTTQPTAANMSSSPTVHSQPFSGCADESARLRLAGAAVSDTRTLILAYSTGAAAASPGLLGVARSSRRSTVVPSSPASLQGTLARPTSSDPRTRPSPSSAARPRRLRTSNTTLPWSTSCRTQAGEPSQLSDATSRHATAPPPPAIVSPPPSVCSAPTRLSIWIALPPPAGTWHRRKSSPLPQPRPLTLTELISHWRWQMTTQSPSMDMVW